MDGGTRPRNTGWGAVSPDLVPYLPGGFDFATDVADYRWTRLSPGASPWGIEMAELRVRPKPSLREVMLEKLAAMANQAMIVKTSNHIRFYMVP